MAVLSSGGPRPASTVRLAIAALTPLAGVALAYVLWWLSNRLLYIGPLDRATFGWLVVVPIWSLTPVAAAYAWRPLTPRQSAVAAGAIALLLTAVAAVLFWLAAAFPNCEFGAVRSSAEWIVPSLIVGLVIGAGLAAACLVAAAVARRARWWAALPVRGICFLGSFGDEENPMTLWVVKAGRAGEREQRFLDRSVIAIGWEEFGDLTQYADREALKAAYRRIFAGSSEENVNTQVGQLWSFARGMEVGDSVVVPLKTRGQIAVGHIKGIYRWTDEFGPDMRHARDVEWAITDLPRTAFDKDLLFSFGSSQTVSTASRNNAEQRILAMLKGGSRVVVPPVPALDDAVGHETERDLEQDGRDRVIDLIRSQFKGHGLGRIVDGVLRAQGFETKVSAPGPDGGVDILAGRGVMGFDEPRIVVQVKSQQGPADVSVLRELKGTMSDFDADQGLLVCWGGFKDSLFREARNGFFKIRLWGQEELLSALFATYEGLNEELRAELPLKRIWTVAAEATGE